MQTSKQTVKIFIGLLLSPDLKWRLQKTSSWKEAQIDWQSQTTGFKNISFQGDEYLGFYLENELITIPELKEYELKIKNKIKQLYPEFDTNSCNISLFSQLFVS